jgi:hypothetical protein
LISSRRICGLIEAAEVEEAAALLGGRFSYRCHVEAMPEGCTGNLEVPGEIVRPGAGTYSAMLQVGKREPQAVRVVVAPSGDRVISPERPVDGGSAVIALDTRVAPSRPAQSLFAGAGLPRESILK